MANFLRGENRRTEQVKQTIALLTSCGLPRKAFSVRCATRMIKQSNGKRTPEFGEAIVSLKDTCAAIPCLDQLQKHFSLLVAKRGESICRVYIDVPGQKDGYILCPGRRDIDLNKKEDEHV